MLIKLDTSTTDRKQITVKQLKINQVERNIQKSHLNIDAHDLLCTSSYKITLKNKTLPSICKLQHRIK